MSTEPNKGGEGKAPPKLTPDQIAAIQKENEDLKAELNRQGDEHARQLESVAAGEKAPKVTVPGRVKLTTMPTGGGKKSTKEYEIAPGFPKVRLTEFQIVQTSVMWRLAQGKKPTDEELKANPALEGKTSNQMKTFLEAQAAKKVAWLLPV